MWDIIARLDSFFLIHPIGYITSVFEQQAFIVASLVVSSGPEKTQVNVPGMQRGLR